MLAFITLGGGFVAVFVVVVAHVYLPIYKKKLEATSGYCDKLLNVRMKLV